MCYMKVCLGANNIRFVFLLEVSQLVGLGAKAVYIFVTFSSCVAYSTHSFPIHWTWLFTNKWKLQRIQKNCEDEVEINVKY